MLPTSLSRRLFLQSTAVAAGASLASAADGQAPPAKPTLHAYESYAWLRGFSVVPSWGARIEEAWWSYAPDRMREEVAPARQVHANCLRVWLEFSAWMADPDKVTANFLDAVAAVAEAGMKTMPCLFNRWHDRDWDYGGTYTEHLYRNWRPMLDYVRALAQPLARDDRVLIWDLCNEPQAGDLNSDVNRREFEWLKAIGDTLRQSGVQQPITIGTMAAHTSANGWSALFGTTLEQRTSRQSSVRGVNAHKWPHNTAAH